VAATIGARPEGTPLTPSSTLESNPETAEPEHNHDHAEETHDHQHGPVLNPECTRELVIDVPADEVAKAYRNVAANYRKYAKIPGFRAGKVPESVIRRRFGPKSARKSSTACCPSASTRASPSWAFARRPAAGHRAYRRRRRPAARQGSLRIHPRLLHRRLQRRHRPKPSVEVTEEEFSTRSSISANRAPPSSRWKKTARWPTATGPRSATRARSRDEGEAEAGRIPAQTERRKHAGRNRRQRHGRGLHHRPARRQARPGAEGRSHLSGRLREPKLAGKTVAYEVEVKAIKKRTLPELNDDFAKELGHYESYADLEASVREYMANRKRRSVEAETKDRLFAALAERSRSRFPNRSCRTRLTRAWSADCAPSPPRACSPTRCASSTSPACAPPSVTAPWPKSKPTSSSIALRGRKHHRQRRGNGSRIAMAALQSREPLDALKVRLTQDGGLARIREQLRREKTASILYERLPA
jgi:trigger factor